MASLLSAGIESEESRIRSCRVPRSTYQLVKRRLFSEALLLERYVPEPQIMGFSRLSFSIARPVASQLTAVGRRWSEDPSAVLVWRGFQSVLGVFLQRSAEEATRLRSRLLEEDLGIRTPFLACDLDAPSVPAYFDFEGSWRNLSSLGRPGRYPRSLGALDPPALSQVSSNPKVAQTIHALLARGTSTAVDRDPRAPHLRGPARLPKSERRALERGWVHWRVFPNLERAQGSPGTRIDEVLLIHGRLRREGGAPELFKGLLQEGRAYPFLFVSDGKGVILGGIGASDHRVGVTPSSSPARRSVMSVLQEHLTYVDVIRERTAHLTQLVDHQFGRVIGALSRKGPA